MMKKLFAALTFILITILGFSTFAQSPIKVRDVYGTLKPKKDFQPTKIAVEEVRYVGIEYITRADSIMMRNCQRILLNDLDFTPLFEGVPIDTFFMRHMELEQMTLLGWQYLGVEYVVKLEAEFPRDQIRLRYRLYRTESGREIHTNKLRIEKDAYRTLVHEIANEIVKFLTGNEGIFRTKLVYSKQIGQAKELFISDYDGHNERPLTNNGSINILPSATPDGQYIYFTSYKDGEPKIYMINLENNMVDLIAGYPGLNTAPAVSPDGKYIACVLSKDGNSEIYLLDRKGEIVRRLTRSWAIETAPTWSPDGREIAFTSDRTGNPQIYVMDAEGTNVRRLTYQGYYNDSPSWSPKGDRVMFVTRSGGFMVCTIDVTGKDFKILTEFGSNENPDYSPDGNNIVFSSNRLGTRNIYLMDVFGDNKSSITSDDGYTNPIWLPQKKW